MKADVHPAKMCVNFKSSQSFREKKIIERFVIEIRRYMLLFVVDRIFFSRCTYTIPTKLSHTHTQHTHSFTSVDPILFLSNWKRKDFVHRFAPPTN